MICTAGCAGSETTSQSLYAGAMSEHAILLFALDVAADDAPREAQRVSDWLVARGWATPEMEPGPRAFAAGVVSDRQGGHIEVTPGMTVNTAGEATEEPLCPRCDAQVDVVRLTDDILGANPYPVVECGSCGRAVAYADWVGTQYPIRSNLTIELESWFFPDQPAPQPMVADITAEMGGRWRYMWSHW